MLRVVTGMAGTALSPEWDRGFDEVFTELVTGDAELTRDEFDAIIGANFDRPLPERTETGPGAADPPAEAGSG